MPRSSLYASAARYWGWSKALVRLARERDVHNSVSRRLDLLAQSAAAHDRMSVGPGTYFQGGPRLVAYGSAEPAAVSVGAYCSIADDVEFIIDGHHELDFVSTYPHFQGGLPHRAASGPIVVGNDVWIGRGATIMPGVRIGDGAAIAARSVVTRDVAPYTLAAGIPAQAKRLRFPEETVRQLLDIRWWEWPEDEVQAIGHLLASSDVAGFLAYAEKRNARPGSGTFGSL